MANVTSEILLERIPLDSPFVPNTKVQYAWDSVSLTSILSCPQRYKLGILEGWTPKNPGVAVALAFGLAMHRGVERYHHHRAAGAGEEEAQDAALWDIYQTDWFADLPVDDDIQAEKDEQDDDDDGISLRNSKVRTRYHLFRALVWYFETYRTEHMPVVILANGSPAVEHSFRIPIGRALSDGTELLVSGHIDHLVTFNAFPYVKDLKTTRSITRQWKAGFDLSHQMTGYTLGGKMGLHEPVLGVCIDAAALQVGGVKFDRFFTGRTDGQLTEYMDLVKYVGHMAAFYYENDYYPLNTAACLFCEFKDVCSKSPELRHGYLNYYYERKSPWNPLANR